MSTGTQEHHSGSTAAVDETGSTDEDNHEVRTSDEEADNTKAPTLSGIISVGHVQRFLDAIRTLNDEFRLQITPKGVTASVLGKHSATKGTVRLSADSFESFEATSGVVGVSTTRLREVTRMSSNSDLLRLDLDGRTQTLEVQADALNCTLQLTDPAMVRSTSGLDDEEYPSVVVLEGGELKRIVKAAGHVDDAIAFRIERDDERFVAEAGNGDDSLRAPRRHDDLVELFSGEKAVGATFDLGYLRKTKRAIRKRTEVTLALGTDLPLSLAFDIADGAGHVEYGIAPVVETD